MSSGQTKTDINDSTKKTKNKKIYFSDEIDSRINGFSLVLTFVVIGILLQFCPDYFGNKVVTIIIKWFFIVFGVLGLVAELTKNKNKIIGLDSILLGLVFSGIWLALFLFANHWLANTLSFVMLIFGLWCMFTGVQQVGYSIFSHSHDKAIFKNKGDWLLFLTKVLSVILVVIQICKAIIDIGI